MSRFLFLPTLEIEFLKTRDYEFDVVGSALQGGRNSLGEGISVETSGGGSVTAAYSGIAHEREQQEYVNAVAARLNGSFRHMNIPIRTDFSGPFPVINRRPAPFVRGIPHSDGAGFTDGSAYSQATVWGEIIENAPLNAGVVKLRLYGATRTIRWSDWFSIYHDEGDRPKGYRAYRTWETLESVEGSATIEGTPVSTHDVIVAISPPLRQAVTVGKYVEFARPKFVGKFPSDFTLPFRGDLIHMATPSLQFIEAF